MIRVKVEITQEAADALAKVTKDMKYSLSEQGRRETRQKIIELMMQRLGNEREERKGRK